MIGKRKLQALVVAAAAALVMAGCGDEQTNSDPVTVEKTTTTVTVPAQTEEQTPEVAEESGDSAPATAAQSTEPAPEPSPPPAGGASETGRDQAPRTVQNPPGNANDTGPAAECLPGEGCGLDRSTFEEPRFVVEEECTSITTSAGELYYNAADPGGFFCVHPAGASAEPTPGGGAQFPATCALAPATGGGGSATIYCREEPPSLTAGELSQLRELRDQGRPQEETDTGAQYGEPDSPCPAGKVEEIAPDGDLLCVDG